MGGRHEEMSWVMWISGNNGIEEKVPIVMKESAMSISMCKIPSNGKTCKIKICRLLRSSPERNGDHQKRNSVNGAFLTLIQISRESCAALRTGFRSIQTDEKLSEAYTPL